MREREMGSSSKAAAIGVDSSSSSSSSSGGGGATAETDTDTTKQAAVVLDSTGPFSIGDKVLAYHNHCLYQAKVQKVQVPMGQFRYHIHYHGWKKSWDEWVSLDRLLKFTQENLQKQKEINKKHSEEKIAKPGGSPLIRHMNSPVARGRKRKNDNIVKEENGELEKPVQIHIPSTLKKRLVDDCEFITHMGKLVKLPRNPNVEDILNKYLSYRSKKDGKIDDTVAEILNGLRCYFDKSFPVMLLYKSERQQYQEAIGVGACPAILYGAEHLLRLFVKLPEILNAANIEEDTLKELQRNLQDILKFLQRNQSAFFKSTYQKQEDFKSIPEEQRK